LFKQLSQTLNKAIQQSCQNGSLSFKKAH